MIPLYDSIYHSTNKQRVHTLEKNAFKDKFTTKILNQSKTLAKD